MKGTIENNTSRTKMNLPQTSRIRVDVAAAGERKATTDNKPSAAAYRDIYDRNALRRKREDLPAHLLAWKKFFFDGGMTPHAPPKRHVRG